MEDFLEYKIGDIFKDNISKDTIIVVKNNNITSKCNKCYYNYDDGNREHLICPYCNCDSGKKYYFKLKINKMLKIAFFISILIFPLIIDIILIILSIFVIPIMWLSDFDCSILKYYEEIPKNILTMKLFNKLFI